MLYSNLSVTQIPTSLNVIGVEKADAGEIQIAIRYFTESIEINPEDPRAYFNRATLRMKLGDIKGAREDFKNAEKFSQ